MATTKITSNVLAPDAAQNNINSGSAFNVTVPTTISNSLVANNLVYKGGNTEGTALTIGTNDAQSLNFETNGSTRMSVTSAGNVGIGTITPSEKLTVVGNISATGSVTANSATIVGNVNAQRGIFQYGAPDGCLNLGADVNTTTRTAGSRKLASIVAPEYSNTRNIEFFNMNSPNASTADVSIGGRFQGSQYAATSISFVTAPNTSIQGGTVNMFIQGSSGNVGIGTDITTPPSEKLTVVGNISASGNVTANTVNATNSININGTYDIQTEIEKSKILAIAYAIAL